MNFDQIESFQKSAEQGKLIAAQQIVEGDRLMGNVRPFSRSYVIKYHV